MTTVCVRKQRKNIKLRSSFFKRLTAANGRAFGRIFKVNAPELIVIKATPHNLLSKLCGVALKLTIPAARLRSI